MAGSEGSAGRPAGAGPTLPRILDPRAVPIAGTDAHLPALPAHAIDEAALRRQLAQSADFVPERRGDGRDLDTSAVAAAVLVPMVQRAGHLHVLLTRRSAHLRDHAGQISFPGGRAEASDADLSDTALRETEEEVGLSRRHIDVVGALPTYTTITRYVVTPVIGIVTPPFDLRLDRTEVDEAFEVPLSFLMNPAHHQRHEFVFEGGQRQFLSMPWRSPQGGDEYFIWGATAAMLRNLYRLLAR